MNADTAARTSEPATPEAWYDRGVFLWQRGDKASAVAAFNQALKLKPDYKEACDALGRGLQETGQLSLAIKIYEHLLKIEQAAGMHRPSALLDATGEAAAKDWFHKGEAAQKHGDLPAAESAFRQVLLVRPDMPQALTNLGLVLDQMRRHGEAQETLLYCLRVRPGFTDALNILGKSYATAGQPLKAIASWRQIIAQESRHLQAWANIAKALSLLGLLPDAIAAYEQVIAIDSRHTEVLPEMLQLLHHLCRWDRAEQIRALMLEAMRGRREWMEPFCVSVFFPEMQLENARRYAGKFLPSGAYDASRPLPADTRGDGKLRIGYLSSDLHDHATTRLMAGLFEQHDGSRFSVYAYSHGRGDASPMRKRIVDATTFCDICALSDQDAAELIRNDGIDILVDLKGYTRGQRLSLMALRPAPLQVHYLGYPGSTGAPCIDYFISDPVASPPGTEGEFSECLIRLPHSYQVNDRLRPLPTQMKSRSEYGLPEQAFVFCDFNSSYKITRDIFSVWMRLLTQVDGSVLWLAESYSEATVNLRHEAEAAGVSGNRIVAAPQVPQAEHLARYAHADLCVDSFPVCGHTTASDALWCGVPVVTMAGSGFISRVAASLLHAVGLPGLVTEDLPSYEALALSLARDRNRLAALKQHLAEGRMDFPLFDCAQTTRALEAAYLKAAERHRTGLAPDHFTV